MRSTTIPSVVEFLWSLRVATKARHDTKGQESVPLLHKAIADPLKVYLRLQSSSKTLEHLRRDEEEPKRPRAHMELVSEGFEEERLALTRCSIG
ncbi:hypothetical protein Patl1_23714 [Pistacia atlantica]|uniref:Uncharacterized protein n=1 Tax=Pistacia atlantica TaxID=434234 RepID=A0ACC0ZWB4_9ROSI|nr:hypothetical protein Patl1_23714 [Pistacia atlantica]